MGARRKRVWVLRLGGERKVVRPEVVHQLVVGIPPLLERDEPVPILLPERIAHLLPALLGLEEARVRSTGGVGRDDVVDPVAGSSRPSIVLVRGLPLMSVAGR